MALKLFNTLSRSVQDFAPLDPAQKKVGMYCCGPTVYDFAHIGNWRTFVFADLVRRYLEFKNFQVTHVMNITDIEDKIIKRVRENKTTLPEFTGKFEAAFFEDLKTLNCLSPHQTPRATEHIPEIISLIEKLIARGIAYKASDGSVYFSIEKYRGCGCNYGQLLKLNFDEMRAGERVKSDEYAKESIADFALWKSRVPDDGDIFWPSPFGEGRPGWHIECSAMSMKILGASFDLHLGGEDLIFPHHEDEIAQSEGATQKPFVKYWLHGAHLLVEGKKMSKSLGNYFTLRDLQAKGFTGHEVRYLLLTAYYRETFNFTLDGLAGAKTALARLDECIGKLREISGNTIQVGDSKLLDEFTVAMNDDLNISKAWGVIFTWVREINRLISTNNLNPQEAAVALSAVEQIDSVLGLGISSKPQVRMRDDSHSVPIGRLVTITGDLDQTPSEITHLLAQLELYRKARAFAQSDAIRDELKAKGWLVENTPKGPKLKKL
jgi:cysteinyl-tRNA synthetase